MRFLVSVLFVAVVRSVSTIVPQDQTTIAPYATCASSLVPSDFGPNNLTDYFCQDYLRGILATGIGIELNLVIVQNGWFPNTWEILQFFDAKVRDSLLDFHYDSYCSYEVKVFQACSTAFRACNRYDNETFESVQYCYETCLYLHPCLHQQCSGLPAFDQDNLTHCVVAPGYEPSSAASFALAIVALLF